MVTYSMLLTCDTTAELPKVTDKERMAYVRENRCFYIAENGQWKAEGILPPVVNLPVPPGKK